MPPSFTKGPDDPRHSSGDFEARKRWQLADIEAGLQEAERGDFASDAEVAATTQ